MTLAELNKHVEADDRYTAIEGSMEQAGEFVKGVYFTDTELHSQIHLTFAALNDIEWESLREVVKCGKDVDHITRTTGYFSKVSMWNPGKRGELKDRHRVKI